jgi:hypothetical protein
VVALDPPNENALLEAALGAPKENGLAEVLDAGAEAALDAPPNPKGLGEEALPDAPPNEKVDGGEEAAPNVAGAPKPENTGAGVEPCEGTSLLKPPNGLLLALEPPKAGLLGAPPNGAPPFTAPNTELPKGELEADDAPNGLGVLPNVAGAGVPEEDAAGAEVVDAGGSPNRGFEATAAREDPSAGELEL